MKIFKSKKSSGFPVAEWKHSKEPSVNLDTPLANPHTIINPQTARKGHEFEFSGYGLPEGYDKDLC